MQSNQGVARLNGDSTHHSPYRHNDGSQKPEQWRESPTERNLSNSHNPRIADLAAKSNGAAGVGAAGLADFFSPEVFQIVLHNPTTAHQLLKFSQSRFCGENMEFLEKVCVTLSIAPTRAGSLLMRI
jgi:spore germination protein YaaH